MCQTVNERLQNLRETLTTHGIAAVVVPLSDPHNSEYMASYWKKLEWLSGFTGSAGTVVVTQDHAGLWTDSRYFLQAEEELADSSFELHKTGQEVEDSPTIWLRNNLPKESKLSLTGDMWSKSAIEKFNKALSKNKIEIVTNLDLVDVIWTKDRPSIPTEPLFVHSDKYTGRSVAEKLESVRTKMEDKEVEWHLLTTLDDIGWLTNLRGRDVTYNPVFLSFVLLGKEKFKLYVDEFKLNSDVRLHLSNYNIEVLPYKQITTDLSKIESRVLINPEDCNYNLYQVIPSEYIVEGSTITRHLKAIKNEVECQHIEQMMVKDGIALVHAFYWLDQHMDTEIITEYDFAMKLAECRGKQEGYYGESFSAIVGYRSNGALNHYRPHPDAALQIKREGMLLCDSGGQYLDGTSDITRTFALGEATKEQKTAFTLVLKGHISVDRMHFPKGTTGAQLDVLARQHLWQEGLNYGHGTGHGVGFFMNVHEPPQGFAPGKGSRATTSLEPGMFTSNEPGYYKDGEYGIRIENLVLTQESPYPGFLCHHNVTLYPLDLNLIDCSLLSSSEIDWVNDYHIKVYSALSPHLEGDIKDWFEQQCELIGV